MSDYNKRLTVAEIKYKNRLQNKGIDQVSELNGYNKNNNSVANLVNSQANNEIEDTSSSNFWDKTVNTYHEFVYNFSNGLFDFVEGIGDAAAGVVGTVGGWFGNEDLKKGASDFVEYDWSKAAAKFTANYGDLLSAGYNIVNGISTGDWTSIDATESALETYEDYVYNNGFWNNDIDVVNTIHKGFNELTTTTANMLPSIILGAATGGTSFAANAGASLSNTAVLGKVLGTGANAVSKAVSVGSMALSAAGQGTQEALQDGADLEKATAYGLMAGAVEGATEYALGWLGDIAGAGVKGVSKLAGNSQALAKVSTGLKELFPNTVNGLFAQNFSKSWATQIVKEFVEEGTEEVLSDLANPLIKSIYNGKSISENYADLNFQDLAHSFIMGGLSTLVLGGADIVSQAKLGKGGRQLVQNITEKSTALSNEILDAQRTNQFYTLDENGNQIPTQKGAELLLREKQLQDETLETFNKMSDKQKEQLFKSITNTSIKYRGKYLNETRETYVNKINELETTLKSGNLSPIERGKATAELNSYRLAGEKLNTEITEYNESKTTYLNNFVDNAVKEATNISSRSSEQILNEIKVGLFNEGFTDFDITIPTQEEFNKMASESNANTGTWQPTLIKDKTIYINPSYNLNNGQYIAHEIEHLKSSLDKNYTNENLSAYNELAKKNGDFAKTYESIKESILKNYNFGVENKMSFKDANMTADEYVNYLFENNSEAKQNFYDELIANVADNYINNTDELLKSMNYGEQSKISRALNLAFSKDNKIKKQIYKITSENSRKATQSSDYAPSKNLSTAKAINETDLTEEQKRAKAKEDRRKEAYDYIFSEQQVVNRNNQATEFYSALNEISYNTLKAQIESVKNSDIETATKTLNEISDKIKSFYSTYLKSNINLDSKQVDQINSTARKLGAEVKKAYFEFFENAKIETPSVETKTPTTRQYSTKTYEQMSELLKESKIAILDKNGDVIGVDEEAMRKAGSSAENIEYVKNAFNESIDYHEESNNLTKEDIDSSQIVDGKENLKTAYKDFVDDIKYLQYSKANNTFLKNFLSKAESVDARMTEQLYQNSNINEVLESQFKNGKEIKTENSDYGVREISSESFAYAYGTQRYLGQIDSLRANGDTLSEQSNYFKGSNAKSYAIVDKASNTFLYLNIQDRGDGAYYLQPMITNATSENASKMFANFINENYSDANQIAIGLTETKKGALSNFAENYGFVETAWQPYKEYKSGKTKGNVKYFAYKFGADNLLEYNKKTKQAEVVDIKSKSVKQINSGMSSAFEISKKFYEQVNNESVKKATEQVKDTAKDNAKKGKRKTVNPVDNVEIIKDDNLTKSEKELVDKADTIYESKLKDAGIIDETITSDKLKVSNDTVRGGESPKGSIGVSEQAIAKANKALDSFAKADNFNDKATAFNEILKSAKAIVNESKLLLKCQIYFTDDKAGLNRLFRQIRLFDNYEDNDAVAQLLRDYTNIANEKMNSGFEYDITENGKKKTINSSSLKDIVKIRADFITIDKNDKSSKKVKIEKQNQIKQDLNAYMYNYLAIDRNNAKLIYAEDEIGRIARYIQEHYDNINDRALLEVFDNTWKEDIDSRNDGKTTFTKTDIENLYGDIRAKLQTTELTIEQKATINSMLEKSLKSLNDKGLLDVKLVYPKVLNDNLFNNNDFYKAETLKYYPNLMLEIQNLQDNGITNITENEWKELLKNTEKSELYNEATKNKDSAEYKTLEDVNNNLDKHLIAYTNEMLLEDINRLQTKYGKGKLDNWQNTIYDYLKGYRQYLKSQGLVSESEIAFMERLYPHYVPTQRELINSNDIRRNPNDATKNIIKAKGSSQVIKDLVENLKDMTTSAVKNATTNNIINMIRETMEAKGITNADFSTREFMQIDTDGKITRFEGEDLTNENIDQFVRDANETIEEGQQALFKYNDDGFTITTMSIDENGTKHYYISKMTEEIYTAFSPTAKYSANKYFNNLGIFKATRRMVALFKNLVTSWNPIFTIRNLSRDIPDALMTTKNSPAKFISQIAVSWGEILKNSEMWQTYVKLGGVVESDFNAYMESIEKQALNGGKKGIRAFAKPIEFVDRLNFVTEQGTRFTEFKLSYERYIKDGLSVEDAALKAVHDAQDITTNFAKGGSFAKLLNSNLVPFLNAQIQGACKMAHFVMRPRDSKEWAKLIIMAFLLGIAPQLLNELCFFNDEEYEALPEYTKESYYLIKMTNGQFLKIPKGRIVGTMNSITRQTLNVFSGKSDIGTAAKQTLETSISNLSPVDTSSGLRTIFAPIKDVKTNTTWYGQSIDKQSDLNKAPSQRYDSKTGVIAKTIGSIFNYSPKKVQYLLEQYTGVVGDILLPLGSQTTSKGTSANLGDNLMSYITNNMTIDAVSNNKYVGEFYDLRTEILYKKNEGDSVASLQYSYMTRALNEIDELENQLDETNNEAERYTLYLTMRQAYKQAIENTKLIGTKLENISISEDADRFSLAEAYRQCFGAEYALKYYSTNLYDKATVVNKMGVSYDEYYRTYFELRNLSTKAERLKYINKIKGLSYYARKLLYKTCGGALNKTEKANLYRYMTRLGFTEEDLIAVGLLESE